MKITRFATAKHPAGVYGVVGDDGKIEVVKGGLFDAVEKTGEVVAAEAVTKYLPLLSPPNVLAIGLNYLDHAKESGAELPAAPLLFIKANTAVIAHEDNIVLPAIAPDNIDYEAEICVIIGKAARNISPEEAPKYIFGYACGNDVSARDCQAKDGQWARAKSFDTFAPFGPCVVTDIDPSNLAIQMRLNGTVMQNSSTAQLIFNIPAVLSYLSKAMTLLPGTVIFTGTPPGVGFARKPPVWLKAGDVCEVEIEGIGTLRNKVVSA
jgi:2-keto-4-pentenoate hydratase/2-oxohepta-3-ene-1,7-dioic acid hydratase in catechol pathway